MGTSIASWCITMPDIPSTQNASNKQRGNLDLSEAIFRRLPEIEARWLAIVKKDIAHTTVSLTDLRNAMGDYLRGLVESLRNPSGNTQREGVQSWAQVAREHAITRVHLGFDIGQLVHEFIVLRRVLFNAVREEGLVLDGIQADLLTDLIESAIAISVKSYAESRDYEFRRQEAEHIGFITHELRNPLTAVVMSISLLKNKIPLPPQTKTPLEIAENNLRRLNALIDRVLLTERLEIGKPDLQLVDIPLGPFMAPILETARVVAQGKKIKLETSFDAKLRLRIDRNLAESAIRNLIDNALKFTDQGTVRIDIEEKDAKQVIFHVRDQCGGISAEELRTVFKPFKRGQSKKPGTGLGLSIARRAVEIQGGDIFAASIPGEGCHFWIILPKQVEAAQNLKAG